MKWTYELISNHGDSGIYRLLVWKLLLQLSAIIYMIVTICFWLRNVSSKWADSENVVLITRPNQSGTMDEFKEINDQVIELRASSNPQIDVVFFHGLPKSEEDADETFWKTWTKFGTIECWPTTMLPEFLAKEKNSAEYDPRILAVSWNSKLQLPEHVGTEETESYLLCESLANFLIIDIHARVGQERPVILVGHDLGGILIKQLILYLDDKKEKNDKFSKFLDNLSSVFFYSTPHSGSSAIARVASQIPKDKNRMLDSMIVLSSDMSRVNHDFSSYRNNKGVEGDKFETIPLHALHFTNQGYFHGEKVCEESSGRNDINTFVSVKADHYGVCQPKGLHNASLKILGHNIIKVVDEYRRVATEERYANLQKFGKGLRDAMPPLARKSSQAGPESSSSF